MTVYGSFDLRPAAVLALNLQGRDSGAVSDALAERLPSPPAPGAHCAPLMHMALGTEEQGAVRFQLSHSNTEEEGTGRWRRRKRWRRNERMRTRTQQLVVTFFLHCSAMAWEDAAASAGLPGRLIPSPERSPPAAA